MQLVQSLKADSQSCIVFHVRFQSDSRTLTAESSLVGCQRLCYCRIPRRPTYHPYGNYKGKESYSEHSNGRSAVCQDADCGTTSKQSVMRNCCPTYIDRPCIRRITARHDRHANLSIRSCASTQRTRVGHSHILLRSFTWHGASATRGPPSIYKARRAQLTCTANRQTHQNIPQPWNSQP